MQLILRKVTDPYDGDTDLPILYRKSIPVAKPSLWARFKGWIRNVL